MGGRDAGRDADVLRVDATADVQNDAVSAEAFDVVVATDVIAEAPTSDVPGREGEVCDNGVDDDRNGGVDDGCPCTPGTTQRCFSGDPANAGVGPCAYGVMRCVTVGSTTQWAPCEGDGRAAMETCDGRDNDCDDRVDEDCPCTAGARRACYLGPPGTSGVGVCQSGTQSCPTGAAMPTWGECVGSIFPTSEQCNARDDDCNGRVDDPQPERCDGTDNNCDGRVDETCLCPAGQTAIYRRTYPPPGRTPLAPSGILSPDTVPVFVQTCEMLRCQADEVAVEVDPGATTLTCLPRPPSCMTGMRLDLVSGRWACAPCAVIVQYGGMWANERVCADLPRLECVTGQVPTFVRELRRWECRPRCDNGLYDLRSLGPLEVCIPC